MKKSSLLLKPMFAALIVAASCQAQAQSFRDGQGLFYAGKLEEAVAVWKSAAEKGDVKSQVQLGDIYIDGKGAIAKNPNEAIKWYTMAALQGDLTSQWNLGVYDPDAATKCAWLELAAAAGHSDAKLIKGTPDAACTTKVGELKAKMKR